MEFEEKNTDEENIINSQPQPAPEVQPQPAPEPRPEKPKKKGTGKKILLVIICVILFGAAAGAAFFGIQSIAGKNKQPQIIDGGKDIESTEPTQASEHSEVPKINEVEKGNYNKNSLDVSDLVEATIPSLVSITNVSVQEVQNYYYYLFGLNGGNQQEEVTSLGSGVIIGQNDTELLIVTNAHVIDGAKTITITFVDETSAEASIKGSDSDVDIAVVAVELSGMEKDTLSAIKIATFGDSDKIRVGEQVVAIGNALGRGQTVTTGIVSGMGRTVNTSTAGLIQTDAAINPGNSGGALFNMNAELIGVNNSKTVSEDVDGVGYAIPSSVVTELASEFMNRKTRTKVDADKAAYIGIKGSDVTESASQTYGIPQGIYISEIIDDGPFDKAGIKEGYVFTKFDGNTVTTMAKFKELLTYYAAGETVEVVCKVNSGSGYVDKTFNVTLQKAETVPEATQAPVQPTDPSQDDDGGWWFDNGNFNFPFFN